MIKIQGELRLPFLGQRTRNDELYYDVTPLPQQSFVRESSEFPKPKASIPMKLFESFLNIQNIYIFEGTVKGWEISEREKGDGTTMVMAMLACLRIFRRVFWDFRVKKKMRQLGRSLFADFCKRRRRRKRARGGGKDGRHPTPSRKILDIKSLPKYNEANKTLIYRDKQLGQGIRITLPGVYVKDMNGKLVVDLAPLKMNQIQDNFNEMDMNNLVRRGRGICKRLDRVVTNVEWATVISYY
ncbi:hypothetical protein H5410_043918 [Solanum commersonii]|uniref:Uncharacterized protein n=1 Tax=Solanum commersonii TaxID=4109 RepID=A0A9J5Y273_SOLCO|nr:hypothetical protein H5410_043918 [Solanum commersonii]